jgi:hypothetical protein
MTDAKRVGDAWGRLAGLAVDACKSHHESHTIVAPKDEKGDPGHREPTGEDNDELIGFILSTTQRCKQSWTNKKGEVELLIDVPGPLELMPPQMRLLPAGANMSNAVTDGIPLPQQFSANAIGRQRVHVSIPPTLPRGLYVGRLVPTTGGQRPENHLGVPA